MRWVEIAVDATDASVDAVTNIMMEEGCGGTAVGGSSTSVCQECRQVLAYLPVDDRLEARLANIRDRVKMLPGFGLELASDEISVRWVEEGEWIDAWKQFFKPLRVGRIVVKPSWEEYSAQPGDIIVEIDPGMAFGTGNHQTTQLCLKALQKLIRGGETMLDVGTGSGILAIAAARLGAAKVVGLDIDSVAVEVARENVERERLEHVISVERADSPRAFQGTADIVVANIIAKVIIQMAPDLRDKVRPRGKLLVSGIIWERKDEVADALRESGMTVTEEMRDGDWAALVMER